MPIRLYSYWRSSAAYRVRIALNLKGLKYETVRVSLAPGVDDQKSKFYLTRNPQGLVPFLEDGKVAIGQSMAIVEYLDEVYANPPLLPKSAKDRVAVRAFCQSIVSDIHPLNNLRVLQYLRSPLNLKDEQISAWYAKWIVEGFRSAEIVATRHAALGPYVFGENLSFADVCLVPQLYNASRFDVPLDAFPRLVEIDEHCATLRAFIDALPEMQPDSE